MAEETTTTTETQTQTTEPPKTHTEADINAAAAAARRDAELKQAKEFGFDDVKAYKDWVKSHKAREENEKGEAQKLAEANKAKDAQLAEIQARADKAEAKAEALANGVPAEKVDRFMRLALTYDGETVADKVKAAIADNPEFKAASALQSFGAKGKDQGDTMDAEKLKLRQAMGLKTK